MAASLVWWTFAATCKGALAALSGTSLEPVPTALVRQYALAKSDPEMTCPCARPVDKVAWS